MLHASGAKQVKRYQKHTELNVDGFNVLLRWT